MNKAIVLLSGGLDSTTAAYWVKQHYNEIVCLSFNYGNRAQIELEYAAKTAKKLGAEHVIINIQDTRQLFINEDGSVPKEAPYRNCIFMLYAAALAVSRNADSIIIGDHDDDLPDFNDSTIDSWRNLQDLIDSALPHHATKGINIVKPLMDHNKKQVIELGLELGVPYEDTMSCYRTIDGKACGECMSCKFRLEAFQQLGLEDPGEYIK